ncbi:unnamed protein product [Linum trigynum]|uniref:Uncharacterized protein n=1 Tax=Linum trigynum TaxID=586398 RepID=A0AAV2DVF0_9ROSI
MRRCGGWRWEEEGALRKGWRWEEEGEGFEEGDWWWVGCRGWRRKGAWPAVKVEGGRVSADGDVYGREGGEREGG